MIELEPLSKPADLELARAPLIHQPGYTGRPVQARLATAWAWALATSV